MAHKTPDRVSEFATGSGTGPLTLTGPVATDMRTFVQGGLVNNDTAWALIQNAAALSEWEIVKVTWGTGAVLTRSFVTGKSVNSAGTSALLSFSAGTKIVTVVQPGFLGFREAVGTPTISGGNLACDLSAYSAFRIDNNANAVVAFSGLDAGIGQSWTMLLKADGTLRSWTWPAAVVWPDGAPTLTATSGRYDLLSFTTFDGVNIIGLVVRQNMNLGF